MKFERIVPILITTTILLSACGSNDVSSQATTSTTSAATTEVSSESTEASETASTPGSTAVEGETPELTDEEKQAVGTYVGAEGSSFILHSDRTADYYYVRMGHNDPYTDNTWELANGNISVHIGHYDATLTGKLSEVENGTLFTSDSPDALQDEKYGKTTSTEDSLTPDGFTEIRKETFPFTEKEKSSDFDPETNVKASLGGITYQIPSTFEDPYDVEETDQGESTIQYNLADGTPYAILTITYNPQIYEPSAWANGWAVIRSSADTMSQNFDGWLTDCGTGEINNNPYCWITDKLTLSDGDNSALFDARFEAIYCKKSKHYCYLTEYVPEDSEYDHFDDFDKIVESVRFEGDVQENHDETADEASTASSTEQTDENATTASSSEYISPSALQNEIKDKYNLVFFGDVRNDVTGKWRYAGYADSTPQEDFALDYYKAFFKSDDEIHGLWNTVNNTMARISVLGNDIDVEIHEYVSGEEHDASLMFSGMLLQDYTIDKDTGEITQIQ